MRINCGGVKKRLMTREAAPQPTGISPEPVPVRPERRRVATSKASVLIKGESEEARDIHRASGRASAPNAPINAGLRETALEMKSARAGPRSRAVICVARCALAVFLASVASTVALAQTDDQRDTFPPDARVLFVSLAVVPTIRLENVGWDDNVLYASESDRRVGDFLATVSPSAEAWLRLPGMRALGRSDVDFVYYNEVDQFRSIDQDHSGRFELLLGRVTPFVGGRWVNARHREQDLEVDLPVRRVDAVWDAGVDVKLTGKTAIDVTMRRVHVSYRGDTTYLDTDLSRYLTLTTDSEGARLRYALTPLTTVGVAVSQYRNRFPLVPERNSDNLRVSSIVEFRPLGSLSGRAEIGVIRRTFLDRNAASFRGTIAHVDLGYTLFGRTRFGVGVQRDLQFSYRIAQRDYRQTGVALSVAHRLASAWDVRGTFGHFVLAYAPEELPGAGGVLFPEETVRRYGIDLGHYIAGMRVGFQVMRQTRASNSSARRDYERTRIVSSLTYGF